MTTQVLSTLSPNEVLKAAFNDTTQAFRAEVNATIAGGVEVILDSTNDSVTIGDESGNKAQCGTVNSKGVLYVAPENTPSTPVYVVQTSTSSTAIKSVSASASSTSIVSSSATRIGLLIYNDSSFDMYLAFSGTASTSLYTVKIMAGGYYEVPAPFYSGNISAVWTGATGAAMVTEVFA